MSAPSPRLKLYKREKLCSKQAIDSLFARENPSGLSSSLAYPLRAVWRRTEATEPRVAPQTQFLISVPKKRLRHAVDRVRIRRLVREAWRLHREAVPDCAGLQIALVYVSQRPESYRRVQKALLRLLAEIKASLSPEEPVSTLPDSSEIPGGTDRAPSQP